MWQSFGPRCAGEAAPSPCAWGEGRIWGELEGAAEGRPGCGGLYPEQQQRCSWQSWEVAQAWEGWYMTGFISPLCCEGCRGSSEQNDAPFAGTLFPFPEHNSSVPIAGKAAKSWDFSAKPIAAGAGLAGVDPAQSHGQCPPGRKTGGQTPAAESRAPGGFGNTHCPRFTRCTTTKNFSYVFTCCLIKEVLGQVYTSIILCFTSHRKLEVHTLFL